MSAVLGTNDLIIIGSILLAIGALILAYPAYNSEDARAGRIIRPGQRDAINRAINRLGKPYFWSDRKIYLLGATLTLLGLIFVLVGLK